MEPTSEISAAPNPFTELRENRGWPQNYKSDEIISMPGDGDLEKGHAKDQIDQQARNENEVRSTISCIPATFLTINPLGDLDRFYGSNES